MLTVQLCSEDLDCHGYVYVGRLARAVLEALGGTVTCTEKTSDWYRDDATSDTSKRERYPVKRERAVWAKIDAAMMSGHLRPVDTSEHEPRERGDIVDAVVSLDEVCKWGEWTGLYRFAVVADSKDVAVKVDTGGAAAKEPLQDKGEPPMMCGTNLRAACVAWAAWMAKNNVQDGDTRKILAERIVAIAAERRYLMEGGALFSIHLVTSAIPEGTTGTRAKNGQKKRKS